MPSAMRPAGGPGGPAGPGGPGARRPAGGPQPPRKRDPLSTALIVIGVALLLVAGGLFVKAQIGYRQAAAYYDGIASSAIKDTSGDDQIPNIDFAALKKESDDIVGWIYIPGTKINYVVAQGATNETYLRHLPNGEYSENGTIFMDMDGTAPGMVDQQTTLYGHHMNNGDMFEMIDKSRDQKTFDSFTKVYYITEDTTYVLEPMFTMRVEDDYLDARKTNFGGQKEFTQYLQRSLAQANASSKTAASDVEEADHVLTLVTCAGEIIPRTTRAAMVCRVIDTIPSE